MKQWEEIFARAGGELHAAAEVLAQAGLHLSVARADRQGASVQIEILGAGKAVWSMLEQALGLAGLAHRARAVPLDRVQAIAAAIRDGRADYYADPVTFVGPWLAQKPTLAALARSATRLSGLAGAVVAPLGSSRQAALIAVGRDVGVDLVAPLAAWAAALALPATSTAD